MHVRNTHVQKFTQSQEKWSFFYAKSNNSVNFSTYKKTHPKMRFLLLVYQYCADEVSELADPHNHQRLVIRSILPLNQRVLNLSF